MLAEKLAGCKTQRLKFIGLFFALSQAVVSLALAQSAPQPSSATANNPTDPSSMNVPCSERPEFGRRACTAVKNEISQYLSARIGHVIHYFYEGAMVEFKEGAMAATPGSGSQDPGFCKVLDTAVPVCEIKSGELARNTHKSGQSCRNPLNGNEFCVFTRQGMDLASCGRELAWIRGFRVSLLEMHRQAVLNEIQAGVLNLTEIGGARVCGQIAQNILGATRQIDEAEESVRERYADAKEKLNTSEAEGCLGIENENQVTGTGTTNRELATQQSKSLAQRVIDRFFKPVRDEKKFMAGNDEKRISHAACNLAIARFQTQSMFTKLAQCEVMMRAKRDFYEDHLKADVIFRQILAEVVDPCIRYVDENSGLLQECDDEAECIDLFNRCYRGERPQATRGIANFFQRYSQRHFATNQPTQRRPLPGLDIPFSEVPVCGQ
ncbi:MAG: hypothetical protein AB1540_10490 [Bdellovibrionota bacterium]